MQPIQNARTGVPVGVVGSDRDDGEGGVHREEEPCGGRRFAPMMRDLQDVRVHVCT